MLRPQAESALQVVLASLNEYHASKQPIYCVTEALLKACDHPSLQFPETLKIEVSIEDCAAKIGLSTLQRRAQWEALLEPLEMSHFETSNLIDATLDWIDSDDLERPYGAEKLIMKALNKHCFHQIKPSNGCKNFILLRALTLNLKFQRPARPHSLNCYSRP